jgi:hypothetical protein
MKTINNKQKGATLVEFALVAPIFFLLLFAVLELSLFYFTQVNLDIGVSSATREIKTGQVRVKKLLFKNKICTYANRPVGLVDCSKLEIDVSPLLKFSKPSPRGGKFFNTGLANTILGVSVVYPYTFYTPMISKLMAGWGDKIIIVKVFKNESF